MLLEPISGAVLVEQAGTHRFLRVTRPLLIRVGSTVDLVHGRARLVAAERFSGGALAHGVFYAGRVVVAQARQDDAPVDLRLAGGSFAGCPGATGAKRRGAAQVRHLWADTTDHFRTVGRYGSSSVRGTRWLMADRCDGTFTLANRGLVQATSRDGRITKILQPGQSIVYFCNAAGAPPVTGDYCVVLWLQPDLQAQGHHLGDFYSLGLAAMTDQTQYDLCITAPGTAEACTTYPLSDRDALGFRRSEVTCVAQRPGVYSVRWLMQGIQLGPAFEFRAQRFPAAATQCQFATL